MTTHECFEYGRLIKAHGYKGEVLVQVTTEHGKCLKAGQSVFIKKDEIFIPFQAERITHIKDSVILKLEDVNNEDDVNPFLRTTIYLPLELLPPLKKDQWYYHQIIGYQVVDSIKGPLGSVGEVYEMPMQDLIGMQFVGQEVLIPINDTFVQNADHVKKELLVTLPDGLIDLYLTVDHHPDDED